MAHWFGIRPWEVDDLTRAEVVEFADRLRKAPPIGAVFLVVQEKAGRGS